MVIPILLFDYVYKIVVTKDLFRIIGKIEKHFPRKKITRNPARRGGRRLVASGSRWIEERLGASDSDESFGEVDERTVEDGWSIEEEPEPKREVSLMAERFVNTSCNYLTYTLK